MRLSLSFERLLLLAGACTSLALACQPAVQIDAVVTARSCTDDAQTMKMEFLSNTPVHNFIFEGGSANVLGIPAIQPNGNNTGDTFVITDLANVKKSDKVSVEFKCAVDVHNPMVMQLANVTFFKDPSNLNPTVPDCAVAQTPTFTILWESQPLPGSMASSPASSLSLEVSDPNPLPITLLQLELAHIPVALDPSLLSEDNPVLSALPWQSVIAGGALLDPAGPPVSSQFPNVMADGAVLCRFISVYDGNEVSGIMQANLSAPLAAKLSTWGGVKSLFRD
jgi:hypothetical protein